MLNVPVVMLVAAVAVLAGVVYVATGRGGELAFPHADYAPLKLDEVTSTDVALFRPPTAVWGYSMQATDEALSRIANAITERDIEIAALQQRVADLEAAAAQRAGLTGPQDASRREDLTSRLRRERLARPPEPDTIGPDTTGPDMTGPDTVGPDVVGPDVVGPDTIGPDTIGTAAEDPDIVLPDRLARPDEPAAATREVPPPGERPEPGEAVGRDVWQPATRAGRNVAPPGERADRDETVGSDVWQPAIRAGRDVAPPDERPDRDEADSEEVWRPAGRAARPGAPRPARDSGAPMRPWLRRSRGGAASSTEWAALPERSEPPAADDEEDGS